VTSRVGRVVLGATNAGAVRDLFTRTKPGRAVALRFVAGETLDDAAGATKELNDRGAKVSLDHLGEHVTDLGEAASARDDYLACIDRIESDHLDANISVKLTQLGLALDTRFAAEALAQLARRAAQTGTTVTVDMEESEYTEETIAAFEGAQAAAGNLGIALQAYLHRSRIDLDRVIRAGGHVRLCKGAYAEPADVAIQRRTDVDASFELLLRVLMGTPEVVPAVATHDPTLVELTKHLARSRPEPWEFQMLYGVRLAMQSELIRSGHPLRVYVPYGVAWYPYLTRRLAERPANLAFFARAVIGR